jgi:hypothetical protein
VAGRRHASLCTSVPQNLSYNAPIRRTINVSKIIRAGGIKTVTDSILRSVHVRFQETGWAWDISMGKGAGRPEFDSRLRQKRFLTPSIPAVGGSIMPPIQWVPVALSFGAERPGPETGLSPPFSVDVKNN